MVDLPTGTVTFLFTDLEGSTRLLEAQPHAYREAVRRHHALLRGAVEAQGGVVFETVGDAVYAAFARPTDAVAAALAGQRALLAADWGALGAGALKARMGLHTGEVEVQGAHYFGAALYRCARLSATAHGGQTVLSAAVSEIVGGALPAGAGLRDLGAHRLKDLQRPEHLFQLVLPDLPADFPPLRTLDARPHNLPLQVTSFVGRERELAEVADFLAAHRLVTLTGVGGTGKTRLALQAAAEALPAYSDGVWLVELDALRDPKQVPQAVAAPLGVREERDRPLRATLVDALQPKRVLLLLDNCEHLLDACAHLAGALLRACPHLTILATSREALGIAGETIWRVPSLALPAVPDPRHPLPVETLTQFAAITLFVDRARAVRPHFALSAADAPAVVGLCALLDGIPLAIELAAARVRALSVEQLLARLADRFRLLTGGSRTALERHQTLQAAVDWSHDLLTAPERVLFRRLAAFAGGWSLEAAEAVCPDPDGADGGLARDDVLDLLTRLVDKSLVLADAPPAGPARYRLLETLRQYAQHKLVEAGEVVGVRTRHAAAYLALAEQAAPALYGREQLAWLDRLEEEHANVQAALAWLAEQAEQAEQAEPGGQSEPAATAAADAAEAGLRLGAALTQFWVIRSHFAPAWEWLGRLLALPGAARTAARARALAGAAHVAWWRQDRLAAQRLAAEGLALAQAVGDPEGTALAHHWLGVVAWSEDRDPAAARSHLGASRRAFAALGFPSLVAQAVHILGHAARAAGEDPAAARLYAEAEALARPTGDAYILGTILFSRALLALGAGDYPLARRLGEEALALRRAHRNPWGVGWTLALLGRVALAEGDAATARARLTEALTVLRDGGFVWGVPRLLGQSARVAEAQGQPERAARLWSARAAQHQAIIGRPLPAGETGELDQAAAALRAHLGDAAFDAAWAEGQAMPLEQAVAYALEEEGGNG